MKSLRKVCLIAVLALFMGLSFAMVGISSNTASADGTIEPTTFVMEEGTSAKLSSTTGLRFRVKVDEATKEDIEDGIDTLVFVITPKVFVNNVAGFKTVGQKITMVADSSKLYEEVEDSGIWYANCVITGIKPVNYMLDYSCVAYLTDGTSTVYTSNFTYNNLYATLNSAIFDYVEGEKTGHQYAKRVFGHYDWMGTENYPVVATTAAEFANLTAQVGTNDWSEKVVNAPAGVESTAVAVQTAYTVTFKDTDGTVLKKVSVKAGEKVSSLPTVATSVENKMIAGYVYNGNTAFTTDTVVNSDLTVTASLVSYYSNTTPYVYDITNGNIYTLPVKLSSLTSATIGSEDVAALVEGNQIQIPSGLSLTAGNTATLKVTGIDTDGNNVRIAQSLEVVDEVDVYINSASDFNDWYVASNYSTKYNQSQYIVLNANIDLSSYSYSWMNSTTYGAERNNMNFNGTFNGQGYNIDNFNTYYGFVSLAKEGTVKNVSFTNVYHTNMKWAGGFFAKTILGTISNVYYSGTVANFDARGYSSTGDDVQGTAGIYYQNHNAKLVENFVVLLKNNSTTVDYAQYGYGVAAYSKDWSSMYIVNELMNESTSSTIVGAGYTTVANYNFYESSEGFVAKVQALPNGFNSDIWTIDSTLGLVFKSVVAEEVEEKNNNYFETVYNSTNASTASTGATYEADLSSELGLDVYSKVFSAKGYFIYNYNNLVSKGYNGWSFAIMSTADTSLIYDNAVKLKANTWYYIHVALETADLVVNSVSYPDWTIGQVYVSSSQYGVYNKVTLADAYLKNTAYTGQPINLTSLKTGTFPMTIYMTNIYVNTEEYDARTEVTKDDVLYVKNSAVDTTFSVLGSQTITATKVDGVANGTSATYANNTITVPSSIYDSLTGGKHVITVETSTKIYTYNVTVADVAISTAAEFESWYGISNYCTAYDDSQYVVLTANIDLSGKNFGWVDKDIYGSERSGMQFNGTFDGQGYNIDNFTTYYGFMTLAATGTIKNVSFTNVYNTGVAYGGGFFGKNIFGTISNVYYSGTYKTGAATSSSGIMYQCNTAVKLENFVLVVKSGETITTPNLGCGFACYAKINSSIYVVNEVMNPTAGSSVAPNGPASTDVATFTETNFFESYSSFVSTVNTLPSGFSSDIWAYDPILGLVFKSTLTDNDYFDTLLNYGNNSSTVKDATLDTTYDIGMTVYKKTGTNAATFYDNYNNLKTAGYTEWSFALMTTVDTSIIYKDAIKLKANTWYFFHVVVEDYEYSSAIYQVGQVYVSNSQYGTYVKQNLSGGYLTNNGTGASTYTCCLNNLIHFVTGDTPFDVYMTDVYAK